MKMELKQGAGVRFGMYAVEDLFMNLVEQKTNRDMAKSVMDKVLSSDRLVMQIMERQLLPDLCSMLRRAFGLARSHNPEREYGLNVQMAECYKEGRTQNLEFQDRTIEGTSWTYQSRVLNFAFKVAKRYHELQKAKTTATS